MKVEGKTNMNRLRAKDDQRVPPYRGNWHALLLLRLPKDGNPLAHEQQRSIAESLITAADSGVISVGIHTTESIVELSLALKGSGYNEVLGDSFMGALGGVAAAHLDVKGVNLIGMRLANDEQLTLDKISDSTADITDRRYMIPDRHAQRFYDVQEALAGLSEVAVCQASLAGA
jgi:hypothetical protein